MFIISWNQKSPAKRGALFYLAQNSDVRGLRALGAFFDSEFDLLSFLQVAETITLNGGEMDEYVRATFTGDKAEAFVTVEPFDCTVDTFRHCICLLWQFQKLGVLFVPSETKQNNPRIKP
jgi:hypothetical protein